MHGSSSDIHLIYLYWNLNLYVEFPYWVMYLCVQELVSEKLNVQQQSVELDRVNEELEKIGLSREKLLQQEYTLEDR